MTLSTVHRILLIFLFALPLTFIPFFYLAFELPKIFLLYITTTLVSFYLLSAGYRLASLNRVSWLYLIFFSWIIISAVTGLSFQQSFLGSYFRIQGILSWLCYGLLFLISGSFFSESHFRKYAAMAILVSSSATALVALSQFIYLWFFGNTSQLLYSGRVISTFGQPNFLGAYLVMSLPFAWFSLKQTSRWWKAVIYFLIVITVLGIFSTTSRSAYLGLTVLALIWGIYHYRLLLVGLISSVIVFSIFATLFPNLTFQEWYRFKVDTASRWTAENRFIIAQKGIELISQKPIFGYGLENFSLAFPKVISTKDLGLKDIVVDSSHNFFLDLAVQTGLVGLGLFLTFLAVSFFHGLRYLSHVTTEYGDFIKSSMAASAAFLIIHQFSVVSTGPMVLFWLSLGVIKGRGLKHHPMSAYSRYIINLLGIILIYPITLLMIQTIRAEILFREASAFEVSDIHTAINLDNEAIRLAPWVEFYSIRKNFLLKQLGY